jgi:molybdopterin/thiamine biosynthesis adenylyltransferase
VVKELLCHLQRSVKKTFFLERPFCFFFLFSEIIFHLDIVTQKKTNQNMYQIQESFWNALRHLKLEEWKRHSAAVPILARGYLLNEESFRKTISQEPSTQKGLLLNYNSEEEYKEEIVSRSNGELSDKATKDAVVMAGEFAIYTFVNLKDISSPVLYTLCVLEAKTVERHDGEPKGSKGSKTRDPEIPVDSLSLSQLKYTSNLNLKLMTWSAAPFFDLSLLQQRVLIIGMGTLGCYTARCLLGWGITEFTLVDFDSVKLNNPVRQSLYTFEHSRTGTCKVESAASELRKIHPLVHANATNCMVPMPGHQGSFEEQEVRKLMELFRTHDVVFLGTDNRESRWFPTLMGKKFQKPVLHAALGFDHAVVIHQTAENACYFCNDVVAPRNSTLKLTAEEKCSVTRPGLAMMVAALAVELWVGSRCNLTKDAKSQESPSQIRVSLQPFQMVEARIPPFTHCTACSPPVLQMSGQEEKDIVSFVKSVCFTTLNLEEVSGLKQLKQALDTEEGEYVAEFFEDQQVSTVS